MPVNDELGKRMKEYYENIPKNKLMRRTPVIIRLDGKAFHTFTKGFNKPFDKVLSNTMVDTMKFLCESIQGCVFGYCQSDEISLLLTDYKTFETEAWFDYEVQKVCSVSAAIATLAFNRLFSMYIDDYVRELLKVEGYCVEDERKYIETLKNALNKGALFDSRCFNIPKEEVVNYFYWRQLDAMRNSVQMVGQANFSSKELDHKTCENIKEMLLSQKNINWNDLPIWQQRGTCCYRYGDGRFENGEWKTKRKWMIDSHPPIFKNEGRMYIESIMRKENNDD